MRDALRHPTPDTRHSSMTSWTLIRRSLRFHARAHFGVVLGAAIGSAALVGALVVGDSLRGSLKQMALSRLGRVSFALNTKDRLFQTDLKRRLCKSRLWTDDRFGPSQP